MAAIAPSPAPGIEPHLAAGRGSTLFLDGMRGLAALYVVISHAVTLLYSRLPLPGEVGFVAPARWIVLVNKCITAFFSRGDVAVFFFFALSGFVIHLRYARKLADPASRNVPVDWWEYLRRRARRLYPPLLLALALTASLDAMGRWMGYPIHLHNAPYPYLNTLLHDDYRWTIVLGNLLFLMTLVVPYLGSNGPLWSLAYEWWFYMLYPALHRLSRSSVGLATLVVLAGYGATFLPQVWGQLVVLSVLRKVVMLLPAWWAGALLADVYTGRVRVQFAALGWLVLLVPLGIGAEILIARFETRLPAPARDLISGILSNLLAIGFCGLMALLFAFQERGYRLKGLERLHWLGAMSYSLYVTHAPILLLLTGWVLARSADHHVPHTMLPAAMGIALSLGMAWVSHLLVERPFTRKSVQ